MFLQVKNSRKLFINHKINELDPDPHSEKLLDSIPQKLRRIHSPGLNKSFCHEQCCRAGAGTFWWSRSGFEGPATGSSSTSDETEEILKDTDTVVSSFVPPFING